MRTIFPALLILTAGLGIGVFALPLAALLYSGVLK